MKMLQKRLAVSALLIFGFACVVSGGGVAAAAESSQRKLQEQGANAHLGLENHAEGILDRLDDEYAVISDMTYTVTESTHYRSMGGGVTGRGHFSEGDTVLYIPGSDGQELVELRLVERKTAENDAPQRRSTGQQNMQLNDGVWSN